jgi:hypothetical protein
MFHLLLGTEGLLKLLSLLNDVYNFGGFSMAIPCRMHVSLMNVIRPMHLAVHAVRQLFHPLRNELWASKVKVKLSELRGRTV